MLNHIYPTVRDLFKWNGQTAKYYKGGYLHNLSGLRSREDELTILWRVIQTNAAYHGSVSI